MLHSRLHFRFVAIPAVALIASLSFAAGVIHTTPALGQAATASSSESSAPTTVAPRLHVVLMVLDMKTAQFVYEPKIVVVHVGDTIEWKNKDIYQHTVTSVHGRMLNSGIIPVGKTWRYKAVEKGTFPYFCTLHPNMKGTLIVR